MLRTIQLSRVWLWGALLCGLASAAMAAEKPARKSLLNFNRDIRPILSDNCFSCHGPDDKHRKAKLRLDVAEEALKAAKSGDFAIVPGHPEKSEAVKRIHSTDEEEMMPPPKSGKKMTPAQVALMTEWIAQGAKYEGHWAFIKPEQPPLPEVENKRWPKNEIDRFVAARLEQENLKPTAEADKTTLIRRAALDLTGLPPTPQEVDAFLADKSDGAYDKLVDRLLESPRYGEQMAHYWMDAARYADSHGYHIDSDRSMWKWRDWVVDAFNKNLPYDQFTLEQLAGDLLPEATLDQKIASGYVRCNMTTGEGGAIIEEYQAKYGFDRLETTGTLWMGLTLTCARCHTHKYDPITNKEYYQLFSFFNNLDESIMDDNQPNPAPTLRLPTAEQSKRVDWLKGRIEQGQAKLDAPMPELDAAQQTWEREWREELGRGWAALVPTSATATNSATKLRVLSDKSILAEGAAGPTDAYDLTIKLPAGQLAALRLEALPDESLPMKGSGRSATGKFSVTELEAELFTPAGKEGETNKTEKLKFNLSIANQSEGDQDAGKAVDKNDDTGWSTGTNTVTAAHAAVFRLADGATAGANSELKLRLRFNRDRESLGRFRISVAQGPQILAALNPPKQEPWKVVGPFKTTGPQAGLAEVYEPEKTLDFKKSYPGVREEIKWNDRPEFQDGKSHVLVGDLHGVHGAYYLHRTIKLAAARAVETRIRADEVFKLWLNGELVAERNQKEKAGEEMLKVTLNMKEGENKLLLKIVTVQGEARFTFQKDLDDPKSLSGELAAILSTTGELSGEPRVQTRNFFRRITSKDWKELQDQVAGWRDENQKVDKAIPSTMVAKELPKRRETFMLMRGEYDKKGDAVEPGVISVLNKFPQDAPTNRLGLAKWLLDPANPLTARVTVNRFWQQYFGVGLVKTTEDFGVQGEYPSNPELLDWLATRFVQSGWDVKGLQRLIATSATYRQSSKASAKLLARDPENRLLARGPRMRLDAEQLRDTAMAVSGLLVDKRGGRSVKPFQPSGLWEAVSFNNSQKYVPDTDEGQYRRSLYTHWKRQSPPPSMLIFDAPTREYCVVRRPRTNTPLQALAFLNDPQIVEASRSFAERMMKEGGNDAKSRIVYGFRLATARKPSNEEVRILKEVLDQQLAEFEKDMAAAEKLQTVGSLKQDSSLKTTELSAWTTVAGMLLNLDETLTKN